MPTAIFSRPSYGIIGFSPKNLPPRPVADAFRAENDPPRPMADTSRAENDPPRPVADTSRAENDPPRSVTDTSQAETYPPPSSRRAGTGTLRLRSAAVTGRAAGNK